MYNKQEKPWHGLGTPVDGLATSAEAIQKAGLDWKAELKSIHTTDGVQVEQSKAVVRDIDKSVLGVVGNRYRPLQNDEAFGFFDGVVGEEQAIYETAGSLRDGKQVWLLAKLNGVMHIKSTEDVIDKYVLLTNSHDGTSPVIVTPTPIRVVCNNTLTLALRGNHRSRFSVRHTENMNIRLEEGKKILGLTNEIYTQVNEIFNGMSDVAIKTKEMEDYFGNVLGRDKDGELSTTKQNLIWHNPEFEGSGILSKLVEEGSGADMRGVRGTLWGAYNVMTEYFDHYKEYSKNTEHLDAIWNGSGANYKERAFKEAVNLL